MKIYLLRPIRSLAAAQSDVPARTEYNKGGFFPLKNKSELPPYELITLPDTALTDRNKPFFIPDLAIPCRLQAYAAFRVGRLGRHIAPRFAHRYLDAMTIVAAFSAPVLAENLRKNFCAPDMAYAFEGSICRGTWQELSTADDASRLWDDFTLSLNGEKLFAGKAPNAADIDNALAFVSTICKIADGDILLAPQPIASLQGDEVYVKPDDRVEGVIGNDLRLCFNVK